MMTQTLSPPFEAMAMSMGQLRAIQASQKPRDYIREMRKVVDEFCPPDTSGWIPATQVEKIILHLQETDPDLLDGWLRVRKADTLRSYVDTLVRSRRGRRARQGEPFENVLAYYMQHACAENVRKVAKDMTAEDHLFVSKYYQSLSDRNGMLAAFHLAVSKKIPKGKVTKDVWSEDLYQKQYESIMNM
jgi:hypothetical protein